MATSTLWAQARDTFSEPAVPQADEARGPIQQRRRRGYDAARDDGRAAVSLVRDDGLLRWVYEPPVRQRGVGRPAGARWVWTRARRWSASPSPSWARTP